MHTAGCSKHKNATRTWAVILSTLMIGFMGAGAPLAPGRLDPDYHPRFERTGGQFRLHPAANGAYLVELPPEAVRLNFGEVRRLVRILSNGNLDKTFSSPRFLTNAYFSQVLPQPDGRVWIEYSPAKYNNPRTPVRFIRLKGNGTLDASFQLPALSAEEDWRLLATLPDGKVLAALKRPGAPLADRHKLLRLQADGSIDPSFTSGVDEGAFIQSAQVLPDGRVVVKFTPTPFGEYLVSDWTRLRPDGSRDDTFNPPSSPNQNTSSYSAVSPAGEILIVNYTTDGQPRPLIRLRTDGSLDPDFHPSIIPDSFLGFLPGGHVLVMVSSASTGAPSVLELDHDWAPVTRFTPDITPWLYQPVSMLRLPDSRYLAQDGFRAWLVSDQGQQVIPFDLVVHQAVKPPLPVAFADGSLFFGHGGAQNPAFVAVNRADLSGPALLDTNGKLDPLFTSWFAGQANWLPLQGAKGGVYAYDTASRLFTVVGRDGSLRQLGSRGNSLIASSGQSLQFQSDLSLIAGSSTSLQRIRPDARVESIRGIASQEELRGFKVMPDDSVLVWGSSPAFSGMRGNGIGKIRPEILRPEAGFHPSLPPGSAVTAAEPQPDGKVLAAFDPRLRGQPQISRLVRLNPDGSRDTQFNSGLTFDGPVRAVRLDSQGRILVAGAFHALGKVPRGGVVRLLPDGTPDPGFDAGDGPDAPVENLFVLPGDDVVLHGDFRHFNGEECWGLVKLSAGPSVAAAPHIISLTDPRTVRTGDNVSLGAVITGAPPIRAQWFFEGIVLPGETNATLTLHQVDDNHVGSYSLFVANDEGADAASTLLTVQPAVAELPSLALLNVTATIPRRLTVGLVAEPTNHYRLQVSTNLTDWRPVSSVVDPNTSGTIEDPFSSQPGPRFVRAVQK